MKKNRRINLVILLMFMIFSNKVSACTCIGHSSVKQSLKEDEVVFKGTVISQEQIKIEYKLMGVETSIIYYFNRITFKIKTIYKGKIKSDTLQIISGIGNGDCGYEFEKRKVYIVYSNWRNKYFNGEDKEDKFLYTDICNRTTSSTDEEEEEIKKYRKPCKWIFPR